jgi:hypothetical protein
MSATDASAEGYAGARNSELARGPTLLLALGVIVLLALLCAPLFVESTDRSAPKPVAGAVDYSAYGGLTAPAQLSGQWRLIWRSPPPGPPSARSG